MVSAGGEAGAAQADLSDALKDWRQGDYALTPCQFVGMVEIDDEGDFVPWGDEDVVGLVVITQTCDIVNLGQGKEWVVVCPLREVSEKTYGDINAGRTPSATLLEHPPAPRQSDASREPTYVVVDLNRMMTIRKEILATLQRNVGISSDAWRTRFAEALERKHGRFAFPDAFNDHVLRPLRRRIEKAHDKQSDNGRAYRSILTTRVLATPSWEASQVTVCFHFVLDDASKRLASRETIANTVDAHLKTVIWPDGFEAADPPFRLQTKDEMTAREWDDSKSVDWEFISGGTKGSAEPD